MTGPRESSMFDENSTIEVGSQNAATLEDIPNVDSKADSAVTIEE